MRMHWLAGALGIWFVLAAGSGCSAPPQSEAAELDVTPRSLAAVPPGTVVADRPPKGYSHLILKSYPRIGADSARRVNGPTTRLVGLLFNVMLADVQPNRAAGGGEQFMLASVAVGLGTKIDGQDTVVSSSTHSKLGAGFGLVESSVLSTSEKQLQRMQCVARSRTMALIDMPSLLLCDDEHRDIVIRYAILVDPQTGQLETCVWPLAAAGKGEPLEVAGPAQWLAGNKVEDCVLHVDPDEFMLGVPTHRAFAAVRMPTGRKALELPESLQAAVAETPLQAATAAQIEKELWKLLGPAIRTAEAAPAAAK